jgi:hypothetical protein
MAKNRICERCKHPIPKNESDCPHCAEEDAAALAALEEPDVVEADEAVEAVAELTEPEAGEEVVLDEEIAGVIGDSDAQQIVHAFAEDEEPAAGDSAVELGGLEPIALEGSSIKLAEVEMDEPEEALLDEEEPVEAEAEEQDVVDLGSVADVNLTGTSEERPSGTIHLAEVEDEEPVVEALAEEAEVDLSEPVAAESPSGVVDLAALGDDTLAVESGSGLLRPDERRARGWRATWPWRTRPPRTRRWTWAAPSTRRRLPPSPT